MNSAVMYVEDDLRNISKFFCGAVFETKVNNFILPEELKITEPTLYEIANDCEIDAVPLCDIKNVTDGVYTLICLFAKSGRIEDFVTYMVGPYIDNRIDLLAQHGFDVFMLKSEVLNKINSLWSIPGEEFSYSAGDSCVIEKVRFKEYNKLGIGGFSTIYRGEKNTVYKVLNQREKSSQSSIARFNREFQLMQSFNDSGFTINVDKFERENMVYQMELALESLEDYLEKNRPGEEEKNAIILRCIDCLAYLHENKTIHRDFHPGNILRNAKGEWVITDFGLAKSFETKYTRATNSTREVGRYWFTDPIQIESLREGSYITDLYSLGKTIDFIENGDKSQRSNRFSSITHRATASDPEARYRDISEFRSDVMKVINRKTYESPFDIVGRIIKDTHEGRELDLLEFTEAFRKNMMGEDFCNLIIAYQNDMVIPIVEVCKIDYDLIDTAMNNLLEYYTNKYLNWTDYDKVAIWAEKIIQNRNGVDDSVSSKAIQIIEHTASSVGRFGIKSLSNRLKKDNSIDSHLRGMLSYHEGY